MAMVLKLLTVLGLGALELWAAIPAGLALRLHAVAVLLAAAIGQIAGVLVIVLVGQPVRTWLMRNRSNKEGKERHGRLLRIWERYGTAGLGFLSPLLVGAPIGTALGLALGASPGRLLVWMSVGALFWSSVWTSLAVLGVAGISSLLQ